MLQGALGWGLGIPAWERVVREDLLEEVSFELRSEG